MKNRYKTVENEQSTKKGGERSHTAFFFSSIVHLRTDLPTTQSSTKIHPQPTHPSTLVAHQLKPSHIQLCQARLSRRPPLPPARPRWATTRRT